MVEPVRSGMISRLQSVESGNTRIKMDFKRTLKPHRSVYWWPFNHSVVHLNSLYILYFTSTKTTFWSEVLTNNAADVRWRASLMFPWAGLRPHCVRLNGFLPIQPCFEKCSLYSPWSVDEHRFYQLVLKWTRVKPVHRESGIGKTTTEQLVQV